VCGNTRLRPGAKRAADIDACPRCTEIAELQWVYYVKMALAAARPVIIQEQHDGYRTAKRTFLAS
jgi:hypothetical protein